MIIYNKFKLRQRVYLLDDPYQTRYTVTAILVREGHLMYEVSYCGDIKDVYEFELSATKNEDPPTMADEDDEDD